jgi:hypothetical protein
MEKKDTNSIDKSNLANLVLCADAACGLTKVQVNKNQWNHIERDFSLLRKFSQPIAIYTCRIIVVRYVGDMFMEAKYDEWIVGWWPCKPDMDAEPDSSQDSGSAAAEDRGDNETCSGATGVSPKGIADNDEKYKNHDPVRGEFDVRSPMMRYVLVKKSQVHRDGKAFQQALIACIFHHSFFVLVQSVAKDKLLMTSEIVLKRCEDEALDGHTKDTAIQ